jgi:diadenosine tetraphosphate (Ap4A) HIT family hydrolase
MSFSAMKPEEYAPTFDLIARTSKALERHYNVEKTYMLAIADMVYHTHFHLIPKHPNLVGMGKYAFRVLEVIEGYKCRKPPSLTHPSPQTLTHPGDKVLLLTL